MPPCQDTPHSIPPRPFWGADLQGPQTGEGVVSKVLGEEGSLLGDPFTLGSFKIQEEVDKQEACSKAHAGFRPHKEWQTQDTALLFDSW